MQEDLPRLETLQQVLAGQQAQEVDLALQAPGQSRKRNRSQGWEVELRSLLKGLLDHGPSVLQGPLGRAIADIDGQEPSPDAWVPKKKARGNRPFGDIPPEDQTELDDLRGLYGLVKDMGRSAVDGQKEILDRLKEDIDRLIVYRQVFWLSQFGV